jgi:hypothetical protein
VRDRWSGWDGWAAANGFTEDERRQLRKLLVEKAPALFSLPPN